MKLINRKFCLVIAAILLTLASGILAGCGDSDDETTDTVTKAQFIKQADEVCGKAENRQLKLIEEFQKKQLPPGPKAEKELVAFAGVPPLATEAEELSELPLPSSGASEAEAFIEAFEAGVEKAEKDPTSLLAEKTNPFAESEKLAREFGFEVCGGA